MEGPLTLLLFTIYLTALAISVKGQDEEILDPVLSSSGLSNAEDEDRCPCLEKNQCPRIYGISELDVKELGKLEPCANSNMVRCCGVTIRVVKKSSKLIKQHPSAESSKDAPISDEESSETFDKDEPMQEESRSDTYSVAAPPPNFQSPSGRKRSRKIIRPGSLRPFSANPPPYVSEDNLNFHPESNSKAYGEQVEQEDLKIEEVSTPAPEPVSPLRKLRKPLTQRKPINFARVTTSTTTLPPPAASTTKKPLTNNRNQGSVKSKPSPAYVPKVRPFAPRRPIMPRYPSSSTPTAVTNSEETEVNQEVPSSTEAPQISSSEPSAYRLPPFKTNRVKAHSYNFNRAPSNNLNSDHLTVAQINYDNSYNSPSLSVPESLPEPVVPTTETPVEEKQPEEISTQAEEIPGLRRRKPGSRRKVLVKHRIVPLTTSTEPTFQLISDNNEAVVEEEKVENVDDVKGSYSEPPEEPETTPVPVQSYQHNLRPQYKILNRRPTPTTPAAPIIIQIAQETTTEAPQESSPTVVESPSRTPYKSIQRLRPIYSKPENSQPTPSQVPTQSEIKTPSVQVYSTYSRIRPNEKKKDAEEEAESEQRPLEKVQAPMEAANRGQHGGRFPAFSAFSLRASTTSTTPRPTEIVQFQVQPEIKKPDLPTVSNEYNPTPGYNAVSTSTEPSTTAKYRTRVSSSFIRRPTSSTPPTVEVQTYQESETPQGTSKSTSDHRQIDLTRFKKHRRPINHPVSSTESTPVNTEAPETIYSSEEENAQQTLPTQIEPEPMEVNSKPNTESMAVTYSQSSSGSNSASTPETIDLSKENKHGSYLADLDLNLPSVSEDETQSQPQDLYTNEETSEVETETDDREGEHQNYEQNSNGEENNYDFELNSENRKPGQLNHVPHPHRKVESEEDYDREESYPYSHHQQQPHNNYNNYNSYNKQNTQKFNSHEAAPHLSSFVDFEEIDRPQAQNYYQTPPAHKSQFKPPTLQSFTGNDWQPLTTHWDHISHNSEESRVQRQYLKQSTEKPPTTYNPSPSKRFSAKFQNLPDFQPSVPSPRPSFYNDVSPLEPSNPVPQLEPTSTLAPKVKHNRRHPGRLRSTTTTTPTPPIEEVTSASPFSSFKLPPFRRPQAMPPQRPALAPTSTEPTPVATFQPQPSMDNNRPIRIQDNHQSTIFHHQPSMNENKRPIRIQDIHPSTTTNAINSNTNQHQADSFPTRNKPRARPNPSPSTKLASLNTQKETPIFIKSEEEKFRPTERPTLHHQIPSTDIIQLPIPTQPTPSLQSEPLSAQHQWNSAQSAPQRPFTPNTFNHPNGFEQVAINAVQSQTSQQLQPSRFSIPTFNFSLNGQTSTRVTLPSQSTTLNNDPLRGMRPGMGLVRFPENGIPPQPSSSSGLSPNLPERIPPTIHQQFVAQSPVPQNNNGGHEPNAEEPHETFSPTAIRFGSEMNTNVQPRPSPIEQSNPESRFPNSQSVSTILNENTQQGGHFRLQQQKQQVMAHPPIIRDESQISIRVPQEHQMHHQLHQPSTVFQQQPSQHIRINVAEEKNRNRFPIQSQPPQVHQEEAQGQPGIVSQNEMRWQQEMLRQQIHDGNTRFHMGLLKGQHEEKAKQQDQIRVHEQHIRAQDEHIRGQEQIRAQEQLRAQEKNRAQEEHIRAQEHLRAQEQIRAQEEHIRAQEQIRAQEEHIRAQEQIRMEEKKRAREQHIRAQQQLQTQQQQIRVQEQNQAQEHIRNQLELSTHEQHIRAQEQIRAQEEHIRAHEQLRTEEKNKAQEQHIRAQEQLRVQEQHIRAQEQLRVQEQHIRAQEQLQAQEQHVRAQEQLRAQEQHIRAQEQLRAQEQHIRTQEQIKTQEQIQNQHQLTAHEQHIHNLEQIRLQEQPEVQHQTRPQEPFPHHVRHQEHSVRPIENSTEEMKSGISVTIGDQTKSQVQDQLKDSNRFQGFLKQPVTPQEPTRVPEEVKPDIHIEIEDQTKLQVQHRPHDSNRFNEHMRLPEQPQSQQHARPQEQIWQQGQLRPQEQMRPQHQPPPPEQLRPQEPMQIQEQLRPEEQLRPQNPLPNAPSGEEQNHRPQEQIVAPTRIEIGDQTRPQENSQPSTQVNPNIYHHFKLDAKPHLENGLQLRIPIAQPQQILGPHNPQTSEQFNRIQQLKLQQAFLSQQNQSISQNPNHANQQSHVQFNQGPQIQINSFQPSQQGHGVQQSFSQQQDPGLQQPSGHQHGRDVQQPSSQQQVPDVQQPSGQQQVPDVQKHSGQQVLDAQQTFGQQQVSDVHQHSGQQVLDAQQTFGQQQVPDVQQHSSQQVLDAQQTSGQQQGPGVQESSGHQEGPGVQQQQGPGERHPSGQQQGPGVRHPSGQQQGLGVRHPSGQQQGPGVRHPSGQQQGLGVRHPSGQQQGPGVRHPSGQQQGPGIQQTSGQQFGSQQNRPGSQFKLEQQQNTNVRFPFSQEPQQRPQHPSGPFWAPPNQNELPAATHIHLDMTPNSAPFDTQKQQQLAQNPIFPKPQPQFNQASFGEFGPPRTEQNSAIPMHPSSNLKNNVRVQQVNHHPNGKQQHGNNKNNMEQAQMHHHRQQQNKNPHGQLISSQQPNNFHPGHSKPQRFSPLNQQQIFSRQKARTSRAANLTEVEDQARISTTNTTQTNSTTTTPIQQDPITISNEPNSTSVIPPINQNVVINPEKEHPEAEENEIKGQSQSIELEKKKELLFEKLRLKHKLDIKKLKKFYGEKASKYYEKQKHQKREIGKDMEINFNDIKNDIAQSRFSQLKDKALKMSEITGLFKAPKVMHRGFHPMVPYSIRDPGPILMEIPVPPFRQEKFILPPTTVSLTVMENTSSEYKSIKDRSASSIHPNSVQSQDF